MADAAPGDTPIYRAVDDKGNVVLVTDPNDAPAELRGRLTLAAPNGSLVVEPTGMNAPVIAGVHVPSLALGLLVGAVVVALLQSRKKSRLVRLAVLLWGIAMVGALYFGFVLRTAGLTDGAFASPQAIVDEARAARDAANAQVHAKEKAADALTAE